MYRFPLAGSLERKPKVRDGECVALIQEFTRAPLTKLWHQGTHVVDAAGLQAGTAIATL